MPSNLIPGGSWRCTTTTRRSSHPTSTARSSSPSGPATFSSSSAKWTTTDSSSENSTDAEDSSPQTFWPTCLRTTSSELRKRKISSKSTAAPTASRSSSSLGSATAREAHFPGTATFSPEFSASKDGGEADDDVTVTFCHRRWRHDVTNS